MNAGVRAGPRRAGDAHGQRARGQLVVGEQHERPIDRRPHDRDGVGSPHGGEAFGEPGRHRPVVVAEDGRHDPEEPARRGRWIVAGVVHAEGGAHGGDGRHADRPADGPRHPPGPADVDGQRRRPPRLGGQRAGPQQLGDLLERRRAGQVGDVVAAVPGAVLVERRSRP